MEDAIVKHPAVEAVGVVGIHDRVHGENVRACVKIAQGWVLLPYRIRIDPVLPK